MAFDIVNEMIAALTNLSPAEKAAAFGALTGAAGGLALVLMFGRRAPATEQSVALNDRAAIVSARAERKAA